MNHSGPVPGPLTCTLALEIYVVSKKPSKEEIEGVLSDPFLRSTVIALDEVCSVTSKTLREYGDSQPMYTIICALFILIAKGAEAAFINRGMSKDKARQEVQRLLHPLAEAIDIGEDREYWMPMSDN